MLSHTENVKLHFFIKKDKIMIKKLLSLMILGSILTLSNVKAQKKGAPEAKTAGIKPAKEAIVEMVTTMGTMKLKLYNETPLHRDNFLKLVREKFYDSLLFHRIIPAFMVQGGDPTSKRALPDAMLGNGESGYTVPAEFNPTKFHKKGALAGARQGDNVNPTKASSGCQFYIVQGKVFSPQELDQMEVSINMQKKQAIFNDLIMRPSNAALLDSLKLYQQTKNQSAFQALIKKIEPKIDEESKKQGEFKFSEEAKAVYSTIGGSPHLDGAYTVYGELTEGMDVLDKISAVERNPSDRPKQDVRIISVRIIE